MLSPSALLLSLSINQSINQSKYFPISTIIFPIPKRGDLSNPNNFLLITLDFVISKLLETVVSSPMHSILEHEGLLSGHLLESFHGWSTSCHPTFLVGTTRKPWKNWLGLTGPSTDFDMMVCCRNFLRSGSARVCYRRCHFPSVGEPSVSELLGFCLSRSLWLLVLPKIP